MTTSFNDIRRYLLQASLYWQTHTHTQWTGYIISNQITNIRPFCRPHSTDRHTPTHSGPVT